MTGMGDLDLRERLAPAAPAWVIEGVCAVVCVAVAGLLRLIVDLLVPVPAPFVFLFPAVLLATLLAGWRAGAVALGMLLIGIWYMVLSPAHLDPLNPGEGASLVLNGLSGALVIAVAQGFRTAYGAAHAERAAKLEVRELLLRELNHRVKNNFQMVEALLDMQRRRTPDPATGQALDDALRRIHSMAQAHAFLYSPAADAGGETIDLAAYLGDLCQNLSDSLLLPGQVRLDRRLEPCSISRDRAAALGLVVNELVTNAAKYAFPDGRPGSILVRLTHRPEGCELIVADDGVGLPLEPLARNVGLGRRLVESFARQAGASLSVGDGPGASFVLLLHH